MAAVLRYHDYSDELDRRYTAWLKTGDRYSLRLVLALEGMVTTLAKSLGIGPLTRRALGIDLPSQPKRNRLADFMVEQ